MGLAMLKVISLDHLSTQWITSYTRRAISTNTSALGDYCLTFRLLSKSLVPFDGRIWVAITDNVRTDLDYATQALHSEPALSTTLTQYLPQTKATYLVARVSVRYWNHSPTTATKAVTCLPTLDLQEDNGTIFLRRANTQIFTTVC
jgi:hypothetical protein